jgi:hypothetical protein
MKAQFLDTKEAPVKWWAARDARMRSIANSTLYTEAQKIRAERMALGLELVYKAKGIYVAYGKRGISVKVDVAYVSDRKTLLLLEADYAQEGITKKESAQGVIYNIPRG